MMNQTLETDIFCFPGQIIQRIIMCVCSEYLEQKIKVIMGNSKPKIN